MILTGLICIQDIQNVNDTRILRPVMSRYFLILIDKKNNWARICFLFAQATSYRIFAINFVVNAMHSYSWIFVVTEIIRTRDYIAHHMAGTEIGETLAMRVSLNSIYPQKWYLCPKKAEILWLIMTIEAFFAITKWLYWDITNMSFNYKRYVCSLQLKPLLLLIIYLGLRNLIKSDKNILAEYIHNINIVNVYNVLCYLANCDESSDTSMRLRSPSYQYLLYYYMRLACKILQEFVITIHTFLAPRNISDHLNYPQNWMRLRR